MTRWDINWYNYVQKAPGQYPTPVPDKQKASVKELVVDNSTNNSSYNITFFFYSYG